MNQPVFYPDWREKIVFSAAVLQPQVLLEDARVKVVVAGLEPQQAIPVHPEGQGIYHFLEGTGKMTVNGQMFAVGPGATVCVPAGGTRGLEAETRLAFLAVRLA